MREVRLYGPVAEKYGESFMLDVNTPLEALNAMCANFPEFMDDISPKGDMGYQVWLDERELPIEQVAYPMKADAVIHITPVVSGAFQAVAAAIVQWFAAITVQQVVGYLITTAISYAISAALSKSPKAEQREKPENKPSYAFAGPVNMTQQGNAIPLGYGKLHVGSQVVAAGMAVEQLL